MLHYNLIVLLPQRHSVDWQMGFSVNYKLAGLKYDIPLSRRHFLYIIYSWWFVVFFQTCIRIRIKINCILIMAWIFNCLFPVCLYSHDVVNIFNNTSCILSHICRFLYIDSLPFTSRRVILFPPPPPPVHRARCHERTKNWGYIESLAHLYSPPRTEHRDRNVETLVSPENLNKLNCETTTGGVLSPFCLAKLSHHPVSRFHRSWSEQELLKTHVYCRVIWLGSECWSNPFSLQTKSGCWWFSPLEKGLKSLKPKCINDLWSGCWYQHANMLISIKLILRWDNAHHQNLVS